MQTRRLTIFGTLFIACALISACTGPTPSIGPKFTGRLLLLAGNNSNGADLVELTAAPNGSTYNLSTIAKGVVEAQPSPDQTQLLYSTKNEVMLRDLRSGAVKSLIKGEAVCLAWSPDGKHFSLRQKQGDATSSKLLVSDLEGRTKLIWEEKSLPESYCAQWIAPDRLVFDRFVGAMTKQQGAEPVKPNTTTVAILNDNVRFVDTNRKWSIAGVCPSGSAILTPADQPQPTFIASGLDHFEKLNPSPGPSEGRFVGFAAQSCVPFFVEQRANNTTDLFSLNPINWQRQRGASISQTFSPAAKMLIKSSARLMIVGDAPATLLLIDTESGEAVPFFPKSPQAAPNEGPLQSPIPVVWIEK